MKYFVVILSIVFQGNLLAQAELDKVRAMFAEPNENLPVEIWKGNLSAAHPVEFYWSARGNEVKGYYRIVSSGEEFDLDGEKTDKGFILSEFNKYDEEIGRLSVQTKMAHRDNNEMVVQWYNLKADDLLEFSLQAVSFSDYPSSLFKPRVQKYMQFTKSGVASFLVEELHSDEVIIHHSKEKKDVDYRLKVQDVNPLNCEIVDEGTLLKLDELPGKLRVLKNEAFEYYELDNAITINKRAYASSHFLMDIDYPESTNVSFNTWIDKEISTREKAIKKEVGKLVEESDEDPTESHFYYKWNSWTEIDFLSDNLVSGRIVFVHSWRDEVETFSFVYDFLNNTEVRIQDEFKRDFNIVDYFNKFIQSEITNKKVGNSRYASGLTLSDFSEFSIAENNLLISTPFHWTYGYEKLTIPHSDLEGLLKRSSILKTAMK